MLLGGPGGGASRVSNPVTRIRSRTSNGSLHGAKGATMTSERKIPAGAVELYSQLIHGEISRRDFMDGVKRYAVAGLTVTAIVDGLMPNYALGQQVRKDDERVKVSYETIPSPNGHGFIRGYFARPDSQSSREAMPAKLPGIIVVHENR